MKGYDYEKAIKAASSWRSSLTNVTNDRKIEVMHTPVPLVTVGRL